ncbi:LAME_0B02234g1_1 [Lachancea meyersii CBS 8951]|uniref:LAME_0B02234g1_1 n=1 Tax=Lachancea meyersii CBS 8951 TaxID=1266667 RepID=A0A1G4IU76_9SACH|nr:LAME_0B02234g1_1 [Lachancea meyersii CBS 8951]
MTFIFLTYLSKFVLVSMVYYLIVFPFVLGINTVLWGPLGITVAVVHSILQVNMYATALTRLHSFEYATLMFEKLVKSRSDHAALVNLIYLPAVQPMRVEPKRHWSKSIPVLLFKLAIRASNFSVLFVISFVPIAGVFIVRLLRSGAIGYQYSVPFLAMQKPLQLNQGDVFYREFGRYAAFGIVSGFLECMPLLSGLIIASNYIGRGFWLLDESRSNHIS